MPAGRPSEYDPDIAAAICSEISVSTLGIQAICASHEEFPAHTTFYRWMLNHEELRTLYAHAKNDQKEILADEMLGIADDGTNDWMDTKFGPKVNREAVQRSQIRIETRKWLLSKLDPKKYGDKTIHSGDPESPLAFTVRSILDEPEKGK